MTTSLPHMKCGVHETITVCIHAVAGHVYFLHLTCCVGFTIGVWLVLRPLLWVAERRPQMIDHAPQVEQKQPFLEFLIPKKLLPAAGNLEALRHNAERLVTPFDVHATITHLMRVGSDNSARQANQPDTRAPWAYNLFQERIPRNRTCVDAKIPPDFCSCENEAGADWQWYGPLTPHAPVFGTCNRVNAWQSYYCRAVQYPDPVHPHQKGYIDSSD